MKSGIVDFTFPSQPGAEIKVVGVGGGGGNAVNHMYKQGIRDVDFVICNTDSQALEASPIENRVQLGASLTEGRGAGNKPEVGKQAAIENIEDVKIALSNNTKMVFITAGMGGGTGTGGAPVIARACSEEGYLTVAIVTIPFRSEGKRRIKQAIDGISELEEHVDSLLVINNEHIREMYGDLSVSQAFAKADDVLTMAAKGIAEIITVHSKINVDFADVETVMRKSGVAIMGTGIAKGPNRAEDAVELAINSPLLNNNDMRGAKNILLNINSGPDKEATMDEIARIQDYVQNKAGFDADLIWGNGIDPSLGEELSVTIVATGFSNSSISEYKAAKTVTRETLHFQVNEQKQGKNVERPLSGNQQGYYLKENPNSQDDEFESLYPITSRERHTVKPEVSSKNCEMDDSQVEILENEPAYKRHQIRMNDPRYKQKEFSNYSVSHNNNIHQRNKYFDPNLD